MARVDGGKLRQFSTNAAYLWHAFRCSTCQSPLSSASQDAGCAIVAWSTTPETAGSSGRSLTIVLRCRRLETVGVLTRPWVARRQRPKEDRRCAVPCAAPLTGNRTLIAAVAISARDPAALADCHTLAVVLNARQACGGPMTRPGHALRALTLQGSTASALQRGGLANVAIGTSKGTCASRRETLTSSHIETWSFWHRLTGVWKARWQLALHLASLGAREDLQLSLQRPSMRAVNHAGLAGDLLGAAAVVVLLGQCKSSAS